MLHYGCLSSFKVIQGHLKLGAEEVWWQTSHSFWDVGLASDAENQLDRTKTNTWIREKIGTGLPEEKGILEQIKHWKLSKYCHWKRRSDSVVLATIEGEIEGKCFPGRRRTAWIDDVRRCTGTWTWWEQMQWKEDTTAGSRMSTGRSA